MAGPVIKGDLTFFGYVQKENLGIPGQTLTLQDDGTTVTFSDSLNNVLFDQFTGEILFDRLGNFISTDRVLTLQPLQDYGRNDSTEFCIDLGNRF